MNELTELYLCICRMMMVRQHCTVLHSTDILVL